MPWKLWAKLLLLPVMLKEPEWGAWFTIMPSSLFGFEEDAIPKSSRTQWAEKGSEEAWKAARPGLGQGDDPGW